MVDPFADTLLDPNDDDYVSPAERAEALQLFKRGTWRGPSPAVLRNASQRADMAVRAVGAEHLTAREKGRSQTGKIIRHEPSFFTTPGFVYAALGAATVGAIVGWYWRKHRQVEAQNLKGPKQLHGLDVLGASRL